MSQDGVHWKRPALGLVEYERNTQNNLVDFDRLGYFEVLPRLAPDVKIPTTQTKLAPHFTSCPIQLNRPDTCLYLNADGLSEHSMLEVEILDEQFRP